MHRNFTAFRSNKIVIYFLVTSMPHKERSLCHMFITPSETRCDRDSNARSRYAEETCLTAHCHRMLCTCVQSYEMCNAPKYLYVGNVSNVSYQIIVLHGLHPSRACCTVGILCDCYKRGLLEAISDKYFFFFFVMP